MNSKINRKEFMELIARAAGAVSASSLIWQACKEDVKKMAEQTPLIWIQGQSCSGCSISLLDSANPDFPEFILKYIRLNFHQTLSGQSGNGLTGILTEIIENKRKDFILVVEGCIPGAFENCCTSGYINERQIPVEKWVTELAKYAKWIIAAGTCSSFGGIPAARGDATEARPVSSVIKNRDIINIPGCPVYSDWLVLTVMHILLYGKPGLDEYGRPEMFYGKTVHENCSRLADYRKSRFAKYPGDSGCLYRLGCLGMDTNCDISKRKWLGENSCTSSGAGCIGCTESVFPDTGDRDLFALNTAGRSAPEKKDN